MWLQDIQEGIDLLGGNGEVYIKEGTYKITSGITVGSNIVIRGSGNSTIISTSINSVVIMTLTSSNIIQDLKIQTTSSPTGITGIKINGTKNIIRNCIINTTIKGIDVNNKQNIIENCNIISCTNSGILFSAAGTTDEIFVTNNTIDSCALGISIDVFDTFAQVIISGNIIKDSTNDNIHINATGVVVLGNVITGATDDGIFLQSDSAADCIGNIIIGNQIRSNGDTGVKEQQDAGGTTNNNIILGNVVKSNTTAQITVVGAGTINANNIIT